MIDTHCHLDFRQYQNDREAVTNKSLQELTAIINIGSGLQASRDAVDLAERYDRCYSTVGLHPHDTEPGLELSQEGQLAEIRSLARSGNKVVAIGEIGLDYSSAPPEERDRGREEQKTLFIDQIRVVQKLDLPVVIHSRDSIEDCLYILKEYQVKQAVLHCFTYNKTWAQKVLDLGFYVSFTGIVTFKNAKVVHETVRYVPLEKMMLETDAPFLAPEPYRGQRCEPWMVKYVAEKVAELKGVDVREVERITDDNAVRFFNLKTQTCPQCYA